MMAAALLSLSTFHKISHAFEYFVGPSQVLQYEMTIVDLQEVVVKFVFFMGPMSFLNIFGLFFHCLVFQGKAALHGLFFVLFFTKFDMTFLSKEWLEVISRDYLFFLIIDTIVIICGKIGIWKGCWSLVIDRLAQEWRWRRMRLSWRIAFCQFGSLFPLCFAWHLNFYAIFGII